ncbi:MAG: hypothetical protein O3C21_00795 [Verrucomicrobia bacterium]|nr:hypothetical protein [Verrucomicrobiota bacterium]
MISFRDGPALSWKWTQVKLHSFPTLICNTYGSVRFNCNPSSANLRWNEISELADDVVVVALSFETIQLEVQARGGREPSIPFASPVSWIASFCGEQINPLYVLIRIFESKWRFAANSVSAYLSHHSQSPTSIPFPWIELRS